MFLKKIYEKFVGKDPKIYAVDFDNTLAKTDYPDILEPITPVLDHCKWLSEQKDVILILWTCRQGKHLIDAINWCSDQGLHFDYVNENAPYMIEKYGSDSRKVYADYYIDDRAVNFGLFDL